MTADLTELRSKDVGPSVRQRNSQRPAKTPSDNECLEVPFAHHLEFFPCNGDKWLIRRQAGSPIRQVSRSCSHTIVSMHPEHPFLASFGFTNYASAAVEMVYYRPMKTVFWGRSFEDARELEADYIELVNSIDLENPVKCLGFACTYVLMSTS